MILLIILTVVFGAILFILSMVAYVERKEIRRIKRYNWFTKIGLKESARIIYLETGWTRFCG